MKKLLTVFISIIPFAACNTNNSVQTKAHVFQRKVLRNGKLMIYYVFNAGKNLIQDSSIVENKIIPHDSIVVKFEKTNPDESKIIMPPGL